MMNKFTKLLYITFFYFLMLGIIYTIHINYFTVKIILYDGALDAVIALIITIFIFKNYKSNQTCFTQFERVLISMLLILSGLFTVLTIPTVIDRSLSFYLLEKIQREGGSVNVSNLNDIVSIDYLAEYRVVDMRITEQLKSGTIFISEDCVRLTALGTKIADFSSFFRKHFLAKKRLINNDFSDELTRIHNIKGNNQSKYSCFIK